MNAVQHQGGWAIIASFIVAYMLTVLPMPNWAAMARPEWAALVLIYWTMALPDRVGVGIGWLTGLIQDALQSNVLGEHALAYALIAYLTLKLYQRIRVAPLWQQSLSVLVMLLLIRLIVLWVNGLLGHSVEGWRYWLPAVVGTLLWPWVFIVMRDIRRRFRVI